MKTNFRCDETMHEDITRPIRREHALRRLIGEHPCFKSLVEKLKRISGKDISVLLIGETGTGKGRCAEFIHQYGEHFKGPFIPFNCGAGPESLFESQIFGHARGAFTGAHKERVGLVEEAHDGILFLDEVNSLSRSCQVKLNHFLDTKCFRRVGENRLRKSNVRIISASNVNLMDLVSQNEFREDLYYRLAEYELQVPPLRERREDITLLARFFVQKNAHLIDAELPEYCEDSLRLLLDYDWPGNIRELENYIKRCLIESSSGTIEFQNLCSPSRPDGALVIAEGLQFLPWREAKQQVVTVFEKNYLQCLLEKYRGKVSDCALHAGIQPPDFWKLLRKYEISATAYRRPSR